MGAAGDDRTTAKAVGGIAGAMALALFGGCLGGPAPHAAGTSPPPLKAQARTPSPSGLGQVEGDDDDEVLPAPISAGPAPPRSAPGPGFFNLPNDGDNFMGTHRAIPKTRPLPGAATSTDMTALLNGFRTGPTSNDGMRQEHNPPLSEAPDCDRSPEESHKITIEGWVILATKETDNDFHMIVSTVADPGDPADGWLLMDAEVSGLPPDGAAGRGQLVSARKQFRDYFVPTVPDATGRGYAALTPVHVRVTGSRT